MDDALPAETGGELQLRMEAERHGNPFLVYRDEGGQVIVELGATPTRLTVGRGDRADLNLESDPEVSRLHAELELLDDDWIVADDGLSRNGSFVNGERVVGRRRLQDGDALRFGSTVVLCRTARP